MKLLIIITILFVLLVIPITAFADSVTITTVSGSAVPGCENTSQGCFSPKEVTVKVGETIYFENTDAAAHTFTAGTAADGPSGAFDTISSVDVQGKKISISVELSTVFEQTNEKKITITATEDETKENAKNVTFLVGLFHENKMIFRNYFFASDGVLSIKINPTQEGEITIHGEQDSLLGAWHGTESNPIMISGPIFNSGGIYNFEIEIKTIDEPTNIIENSGVYNANLSIADSTKFLQKDAENQPETNSNPSNLIPQPMSSPKLEEYIESHFVSAKKLGKSLWADLKINEEKDQLVAIQTVKPFPGYGKGQIALELISADIKNDTYSNFKSLGFENLIDFALNSKTGKIYLYEFERQDILIIDSSSLEIIDTIEVHFETNYRQRDISVNENTNKIYLLLEEMGSPGRSVHDLKYKIQIFDGNVKKMIKEIELNEPVDRLLIDQTNNFVYADNWVEQKYFIIDNSEELNSISFTPTANQYISSFLINEKNNQMFIGLGDEYGNLHEILVLDASSGKEIERIVDPAVKNTNPIISIKNDVLIFKTDGYGGQYDQGFTIMNLREGENKIVKEISLPDMLGGRLLTIDEKNGKLYTQIAIGEMINGLSEGSVIYDLYDLFTTSTQGNPEEESKISGEYKSCWDNIRKIDTERARESYFSSDGISSYWIESKTMFDEMIQKCEEIKTDALEEAKIQEAVMKKQRLSFPKTVDSRCDLVYLLLRLDEERQLGPDEISLEKTKVEYETIMGEVEAILAKYQQRISDEPWNVEELNKEASDEIEKYMIDFYMKRYSVSSNLREAVSKMIGGSFDVDVMRPIVLLEPKHYAEDVECGKMLKTHYYDVMYQINESVYGQSTAEKMGVAIDEAIAKAEQKNTPFIKQGNSNSKSICGTGTVEKDGKCVVEKKTSESKGGGCLIATATYGSELAPQVQQLRELRDNSLLQTESGISFMTTFNQFYYSFSPTIADWERENPIFKEMVKIAITPMISSLSIMTLADSEAEVLGLGISVIALNLGMYFVAPVVAIHKIRKKF